MKKNKNRWKTALCKEVHVSEWVHDILGLLLFAGVILLGVIFLAVTG